MHEQWPEVLAKLCDAIRRQGGDADWDGEHVTITWPNTAPIRLEIVIDGDRLLTAVSVPAESA